MSTFLPPSVSITPIDRLEARFNSFQYRHADLAELVSKLTVAVEALEEKVKALDGLYREEANVNPSVIRGLEGSEPIKSQTQIAEDIGLIPGQIDADSIKEQNRKGRGVT